MSLQWDELSRLSISQNQLFLGKTFDFRRDGMSSMTGKSIQLTKTRSFAFTVASLGRRVSVFTYYLWLLVIPSLFLG